MKSHLHPTNCIGIRLFAEQHGRVDLMNRTDQYIRDNFLDVVRSDEFSNMTPSYLVSLVASPDINVDSEQDVYEAVMSWIQQDTNKRKVYLSKLLAQVKHEHINCSIFTRMSIYEILWLFNKLSSRFTSLFSGEITPSGRDLFNGPRGY